MNAILFGNTSLFTTILASTNIVKKLVRFTVHFTQFILTIEI